MKNPLIAAAVLIVVAGVAALYAWYVDTPPPASPPPPVAAVPAPPPEAPALPAIQHPLPPPPAAAPPLPSLAESDATAQAAAVDLFGRDAFVRHFVPEALVRNFVVTVDNLPRKTASVRMWPVRAVPGPFAVAAGNSGVAVAPDNALRYRPYLVTMEAVEAKRLVAAYVRLYPLFQKAYEELGYPKAYFNDRLVQAIDDMLAAPDVSAPELVQPKVLYQFADPALEDRSAGQKIMIRMGPANAARVKEKLRAIRKEIVAMAPQS